MEFEHIVFTIGDDGVARKYIPPYTTVEFQTKEDFEKFNNILKENKKLKKENTRLKAENMELKKRG